MTGVNKVILVGNLGANPEMKYTSSGVPVTSFKIATTEWAGTDDQGNRKEHTEWHRIVAWRKLGEICNQYLEKGTKVYIEGRIRQNTWQGQDGVKRYYTDIHADQMVILTPKGMRESVPKMKDEDVPEYNQNAGSFPGDVADSGDVQQIDMESDDLDDNFL